MPLSDIAQITISSQTAGIDQEGFGVPLILGCSQRFAEPARTYNSLQGMVDDGFEEDDAEYNAAAAIFSQARRPPTIVVGRRSNLPTGRWAITPTATHSASYRMTIGGEEVDYPADSATTVTEIIAGLKADIDALNLDVTVSDQTTYMRIVEDEAGALHQLAIDQDCIRGENGCGVLSVVHDHADNAVATDLATVLGYNSDWYCLITTHNSSAQIVAAAEWVEANERLYIAGTQDTTVMTLADDGSDLDVAQTLETSARARTAVIYSGDNFEYADAAWAGNCLPFTPGSETWFGKTLSGVSATRVTSTHQTNLEAKNCSYVYTVAGRNITKDGKVAAGEYIDIVRGRDWLKVRMQERIFIAKTRVPKIPYTDAGANTLAAEVQAQLRDGVDSGLLKGDDPEPAVYVARVSTMSDANRADRIFTGITFSAEFAGAIHLTQVEGTLSV